MYDLKILIGDFFGRTTAKDVLEKLNQTITDMDSDWKEKLRLMLFKEYTTTLYENLTTPEFYLSKAENMKMTEIDNRCGDSVRWCTVNDNELNKCNWTSVTLRSLGIDPVISCVPARSTFECFEKINKNEADIISIDSNYGHLARKYVTLKKNSSGYSHKIRNKTVLNYFFSENSNCHRSCFAKPMRITTVLWLQSCEMGHLTSPSKIGQI